MQLTENVKMQVLHFILHFTQIKRKTDSISRKIKNSRSIGENNTNPKMLKLVEKTDDPRETNFH